MTKLHRFALGMAVAAAAAHCAEISGVVQTADGKPVESAQVVISVRNTGPDTQPYYTVLTTAADGSYKAADVPAGTFTVCPQKGGTDLLSPCAWEPSRPTITVAQDEKAVMKPLVLKQGVHIKLRVDDAGGRLAFAAGKQPVGQVFTGVRAANGFVMPMIVKPKGAGQDHDAVVPYDTDVEVHVFGGNLDVRDDKGAAIDRAGRAFRVRVNRGENPPEMKFSVAGAR